MKRENLSIKEIIKKEPESKYEKCIIKIFKKSLDRLMSRMKIMEKKQ